jgi:hypothetical protein
MIYDPVAVGSVTVGICGYARTRRFTRTRPARVGTGTGQVNDPRVQVGWGRKVTGTGTPML